MRKTKTIKETGKEKEIIKFKEPLERISIRASIVTKVSATNISVFLIACLLILSAILTVNIMYHNNKDMQTMNVYISNTMSSIDNALKDMGRVSLVCFSDDEVQRILRENKKDSLIQQVRNGEYLKELYTSLITIRNDITGVYMFDTDSLIFYQDTLNPSRRMNADTTQFFKQVLEQEESDGNISGCQLFLGESPEFMRYLKEFYEDPYKYHFLYLVRSIKSFSPHETIGHIVLATPVETIKNMLEEYQEEKTSYLLLDGNGDIVCSEEETEIGKNLWDVNEHLMEKLNGRSGNFLTTWENANSLLVYQKSEYSDLTLITAKPISAIFMELKNLIIYCCIITIVFAVIALLSVYFLTRKGLRRVTDLSYDLSHFEKSSLTKKYEIEKNDEIGQLKRSINSMIDTINNLLISEYEGKMKLQEAQIVEQNLSMLYLKNQINPHFLYNTLDMIRIKAALNDDTEVANMLMQLVTFYRLSTKVDSSLVPVEHEMKMLDAYMKLMCYRYPNLTYKAEIDQKLLYVQIPNFMLQPLVENCILHGLRNRGYKGSVQLKIFSIEETDSLEIQITDDGIGMSDEMLKQMNAYEQTKQSEESCPPEPEQMHIGIANLQRRLRYFYGEDCRIVFSNREEGGLSVVIRMKCTVSHGNKTKKWTGA